MVPTCIEIYESWDEHIAEIEIDDKSITEFVTMVNMSGAGKQPYETDFDRLKYVYFEINEDIYLGI